MFLNTVFASIAALALATTTVADTCTRTAVVSEGDICDEISAAHNSSTYQLATVNHAVINPECTNLAVGQTLCLGLTSSDCMTTHVVAAGDTCIQISSQFGINVTTLYANNPQINTDCSNIYIGEVLCTFNQIRVPAATSIAQAHTSVAPGNSVAVQGSQPTPAGIPWCD